ncbi:MAG: amidohydrolase [Proteobacteria bacterium]|nr:amidohydrolase [Pseudomonadota bacterium]
MVETGIILYLNGKIISMDSGNSIFQALATQDDKILALGSNEEIKSLATSKTRMIDLDGKTMLPGFVDPHGHFFFSCFFRHFYVDLNSPPMGEVTCIDDILTKLKIELEQTKPGAWLTGFGYDDTLISEKRHPNRYDLDRVSTDFPIIVRHISGHVMAVNSKALELKGINRNTPQPAGGHIQIDPSTGEPLGIMEEPSAMILVQDFLPVMSTEMAMEAISHGSKRYLRTGTTTAQEGFSMPNLLDIFLTAEKGGELKNRIHVLPSGIHELDLYPSPVSGSDLSDNQKVSLGAVKLFQDGSIQAYTACLSQPYYSLPENRPELAFNYHGYRVNQPLDLQDQVIDLHTKGWQIAIHSNGDMAIDDCLNAFEAAQKFYPRDDVRHIVIHCQTVREDQLDRIKRLGVIPAFFSVHTYFWGDRHKSLFLGPLRADNMNPCRSALQRGIPFTNHNDDFVTPINPLLSIWSAVNRLSTSGKVIGEDQRIPVLEAIRSVTSSAAYQNHEESTKGSLERGKLADMVVLAENPLEIDPVKIKEIEVLATIVAGELVTGSFS